MGAQWVHGSSNNAVYTLLKSLNLLDETTKSKHYYTFYFKINNLI
jgi:hypothetical protein